MTRWFAALLVVALGAAQNPLLESGVYAPDAATRITNYHTTDMAALDIRVVTLDSGAVLHDINREHRDVEELLIVTRGRLSVWVNDHLQVVGPGSVAMIMPGHLHRFWNAGREPLVFHQFQYRAKQPANPERGQAAGGSFVVDWDSVPVQTTPTGFRRNICDRPTAMFPRFEMHVSTLNAGLTNHAAHTHRPEEFVLMLKGHVNMLIGEGRHDASVGDLIFLASQLPHSLDNTGTGPAEYFAFQGW